jgi:RNA polymerase sigma-70 factor (ECF subfamily)
MTDIEIISLFNTRNEAALHVTQEKYGAYCRTVAQNILNSTQDVEECVNDMLLKAWNRIPPEEPKNLLAFLGKITRNTALDMYRHRNTAKRGGGQLEVTLSEAEEFIVSKSVEQTYDRSVFTDTLNIILEEMTKQQRIIFLRRYLYFYSVGEIAAGLNLSESKVKSILFRLRKKLKTRLEKEGMLL